MYRILRRFSFNLYTNNLFYKMMQYQSYYNMLANYLRIGPILIVQVFLVLMGIVLLYMFDMKCWGYALIQVGISLYLVQIIIASHMIQNVKKYKRKYLMRQSHLPMWQFYPKVIWNQLNFLAILVLYLYISIKDGFSLYRLESELLCNFYLYPMCLEFSYENKSQQLNKMYLWLLYAFFNIFNLFLVGLAEKRYYDYLMRIAKIRRSLNLRNQEKLINNINESLLQTQTLECAICLSTLEQDTRILSCNHKFHTQCIKNWLDQKYECPYRCAPESDDSQTDAQQ